MRHSPVGPGARRWPRWAVAALPALLLACGPISAGDPAAPALGEDPPNDASPQFPLVPQAEAADQGEVEIMEVGFHVAKVRDTGSASVTWAAVVENTSDTDLLAHAAFNLTWHTSSGETRLEEWHESPQTRAYDVLPGETVVIGGPTTTIGFVPSSLEVSVHTSEWYPMRELAAHGIPVGIEVTGFRFEFDSRVRVYTDFVSHYQGNPRGWGRLPEMKFRLLVVFRDSDGNLLGAMPAVETGVRLAGEREQYGSIERSWWPAEADPDISEVSIVKSCCAWVGTM